MKIEFNKVTWYSKVLAIIIFIGAIIFAFFLGRVFERETRVEIDLSQNEA